MANTQRTYDNTDIEYGSLPYEGDIQTAKNGSRYVETEAAKAPSTGTFIGDTFAKAWRVTGHGKSYARRIQMVRQDFTGDFEAAGEETMEMVRSYVKQV